MNLERGTLTEEQIRGIVRHLPAQLTFADEHDVLRYWNEDDCDPRYIGEDVRDCHPTQSLPTLERILGEFKAGRRDFAEGWREISGRFKLLRYIAIRDEAGDYKGILEVSVDLTDYRCLEGEKALPGW
jgi:DUF438 domain-containing protein